MIGPVGDVEVTRDHLHGTVAILPVDADLVDALASLDRELAERHSRAHDDLLEAMDSPRYVELLAALTAFMTNSPWAAKVSKRHTLPGLVGRTCACFDRAAKAAESVLDVGGPELHGVRKTARRARYAAEVAGQLVGSPAHTLARRMEEPQEVLGRHQDSVMARGLLRALGDRVPERQVFALGRLMGRERASDESVQAECGLALAAASTEKGGTGLAAETHRATWVSVVWMGSCAWGRIPPHREHLGSAFGHGERVKHLESMPHVQRNVRRVAGLQV